LQEHALSDFFIFRSLLFNKFACFFLLPCYSSLMLTEFESQFLALNKIGMERIGSAEHTAHRLEHGKVPDNNEHCYCNC
jgi:hypothetical protein